MTIVACNHAMIVDGKYSIILSTGQDVETFVSDFMPDAQLSHVDSITFINLCYKMHYEKHLNVIFNSYNPLLQRYRK